MAECVSLTSFFCVRMLTSLFEVCAHQFHASEGLPDVETEAVFRGVIIVDDQAVGEVVVELRTGSSSFCSVQNLVPMGNHRRRLRRNSNGRETSMTPENLIFVRPLRKYSVISNSSVPEVLQSYI